jgi:hypothetical protein
MASNHGHTTNGPFGTEGATISEVKSVSNGELSTKKSFTGDNFSKEDDSTTTDVEEGRMTTEEEASTDYPGGFHLFIIVLALILSVFLVALDMVSNFNVWSVLLVLTKLDNRGDGNP